jgi:hypothetical protein
LPQNITTPTSSNGKSTNSSTQPTSSNLNDPNTTTSSAQNAVLSFLKKTVSLNKKNSEKKTKLKRTYAQCLTEDEARQQMIENEENKQKKNSLKLKMTKKHKMNIKKKGKGINFLFRL